MRPAQDVRGRSRGNQGPIGLVLAASVAALAMGCASPQPLDVGLRRSGLTWKQDIGPLLARDCAGCHGGLAPGGGMRADDYFQIVARARAGDETSPLLAIQTSAAHVKLASAFALLRTWVVEDDLGYETSSVHGAGLMNPSDPTFHGAVARDLKWNLDTCAKCHGADFGGGKAGASCTTCHQGGPTSCTGCHGQPPRTGAHEEHVFGGELDAKLDCVECHVKPAVYTDAGHLHTGKGKVTFGALASAKGSTPAYDPATQTCSGVYCHNPSGGDTAATLRAPIWGGDEAQAACGTCHGMPPSGHQNTGDQCARCHGSVVDAQRRIVDASKHANGVVDFGAGSGCTSCHGQPPTTGAHEAHVLSAHQLAAPVACGDCHVVPATVDAPGHLSSDVKVTLGGARATGGGKTQPTYDAASAACSNVSCHGSAQPKWSDGAAAIACGTCHGVPPATAAHAPGLGLADCVTCHAATVGAGGAIKVGGAHINGVIDVQK